MDSSSCSTNPVGQFLSPKNNTLLSTHRPIVSRKTQVSDHYNTNDASPHETTFMNRNNQDYSVNRPHLLPAQSQQGIAEDWASQFSSMQIKDPLEFSQEYKRLYSSYESSQPQRQVPPMSMNVAHQPLPQPSMFVPSPLRQQRNGDGMDIDSYFDLQFQSVEKELEIENNANAGTARNDNVLDEEQLQLQKTARDIVESCSTPSSISSNSSVNAKFAESKFIGLMRKISDGVVTLKKINGDKNVDQSQQAPSVGNNEFYSTVDESVVGTPFYPVDDTVHM
ncbi:hypothetical protein NCAS_0A07250 [Naumovozyma castellii]|uniref:PEX18/PEX21 C-terminal domain-containing protein n=1 Tax=Naumovozyma castellii TaxID=27288 RepID=G0V735_NAUCA|nr:hypothetical protein NCAS_0A07250 [Naumovozyma castellii CBS 4309]CCC67283.1 hypothetical protein NCAS_0A07250 [Naumovozyma castellii CBS 4309]